MSTKKQFSRGAEQAKKIGQQINDTLLTRDEMKSQFGLSKNTLYAMVAHGQLPAPLHVGRYAYWVKSSVVQAFVHLKERGDRNVVRRGNTPASQEKA